MVAAHGRPCLPTEQDVRLLRGVCRRATMRHTARVPQLRIAQDPVADELLGRDPLALVLGMLLDQHMRQRSSGARG